MMRSTIKQFYQGYFSATQDASWLARLMAGRRQEILGELMQWGVTSQTSDH
ncbi:glucose uptake inhibitor SgrT [Klebsiella oxytoca]|uniref:Glucose uptake inhibitor SgrT n=1 Tax=Klebsiella oxytoca TaxID=571 RepID=A0A6B8MJU5_KLEOX|nr:glucose uptake inhibitor SgrT [Klebsiella oxytoca]QGN36552.1 glucose uptake inhibitor SgrT [Klebsiella oxytoca]